MLLTAKVDYGPVHKPGKPGPNLVWFKFGSGPDPSLLRPILPETIYKDIQYRGLMGEVLDEGP